MTRIALIAFLILLLVVSPFSLSQSSLSSASSAQQIASGNEPNNKQGNHSGADPLKLNIAEALDVDDSIERVEQKYEDFLSYIGINDQKFSEIASSIIIVIIFIFLKLIFNFTTNRLTRFVLGYQKKLRLNKKRIIFYKNSIEWVTSLILFLFFMYVIMAQWNIEIGWLSESKLMSLIGSMLSLLLVVLIAIAVIESVSGLIERFFRGRNVQESRVKTVKPIAKNLVIGFLFFVFGMLALSQLGIDIIPLLAGAGVVGIAVGFGAQALVKDVITGFIIILEDLIQVGDVVTLGGCTGMIERITIRKVQLRSLDGTVYTVSFGDVSTVANMTKVFSYYLMDIGVAYRENVDEVQSILNDISTEMRADESYKNVILDDLEILGLDQFADSAVIIKARLKTRPKKQWNIGREFNRRMKIAFDQNNIEIPFPHQTLYIGQDKEGGSPSLNVKVKSDFAQNSATKKENNDPN